MQDNEILHRGSFTFNERPTPEQAKELVSNITAWRDEIHVNILRTTVLDLEEELRLGAL
jgi:hypothetical protein